MDSSRVYWIGGSPCSGKSTIANALADRFGLSVYRCDDAYFQHQHFISSEQQPIFHRLTRAMCDDIWLRPVSLQIAEERALYREEFPFILDDIAQASRSGPLIVEGAALLPELLDSHGVSPRRSLWIVPTEAFQRTYYALREWRHDVLSTCSDPEGAWHNWMARDVGFAQTVAADARRFNQRLIVVDGSRSIADSIQDVADWFGLQFH